MKTRYEIARVNVSKNDIAKRAELLSQGYSVLRKSNSTVIMVLWGEEKSAEVLASEVAEQKAMAEAAEANRVKAAQSLIDSKKECRAERQQEVTVANLWRNFNRRPAAHMNISKNSFYFETPNGDKVRVSDHESYHFQLESEKAQWSRAADFEAPDLDFVISEFEGKTRAEAVEIIKQAIK